MKKVTMTWLKKMFSLMLALVMLMPMSVYATENVNESELSYSYDAEAGAWVLSGLEYEEVDDDEIEIYTYNMYFSEDISDVANVKGNFLGYTEQISGAAYAFAKYAESEGVYTFNCTYDGESYRFCGDDKQCDSRTFISEYQDICEDEQSEADNRSAAWTAEELAGWIYAELNIIAECFEVFNYNAYYNKQMFSYAVSDEVVKTIEIPSAEELYFEDWKSFLLDDYRANAYTLNVTDGESETESITFEGESYQVIFNKKLNAKYENANLIEIERPFNVFFDIAKFDTSVNDYYVAYDDDGTWKLEVLRNSDEGLLWDSGRLGEFFVVSKAADIIATTEEGVNVTTAHLFSGGSLDLDAAGIKYTDGNMKAVLDGYLSWAADDVLTSEKKYYCMTLFYGTVSAENRNNDLMMEITADAWNDLEFIQKNGGTFLVNMGTETGGAMYFKNIKKATKLGFATHDYLENEHWDFYGEGFDFSFMEFPYGKSGAVQFLYQKADGTMGRADIKAMSNQIYHDISTSEELPVVKSGLHFLVPKNTELENTVVISKTLEEETLTKILAGSATTLEDSLKVTFSETDNQDVGAEVFSNIAKNAEMTGIKLEQGDICYEISADDMKNDVSMTVGAEENTENVQQVLGETALFAIDFAHSGDLPGNTKVTVPVDLEDGTYVWSYLNDAGELVESQNVAVKDGQVQAVIKHCSTYVVTKENSSGDENYGTEAPAEQDPSTSKKKESKIAKIESTGKHIVVKSLSDSVIEDGKKQLENLIGDSVGKYRLALAVDLSAELKGRTDVRIQVDEVTANDAVIILNKGKDGWKSVPNVAGNGYVIGKFDHFSPVLIFVDKDGELEAAQFAATPVSVQTIPAPTGDSSNIVFLGLIMICTAVVLIATKKRFNSN